MLTLLSMDYSKCTTKSNKTCVSWWTGHIMRCHSVVSWKGQNSSADQFIAKCSIRLHSKEFPANVTGWLYTRCLSTLDVSSLVRDCLHLPNCDHFLRYGEVHLNSCSALSREDLICSQTMALRYPMYHAFSVPCASFFFLTCRFS